MAELLVAKYPDILKLNPKRPGEVLMVKARKEVRQMEKLKQNYTSPPVEHGNPGLLHADEHGHIQPVFL